MIAEVLRDAEAFDAPLAELFLDAERRDRLAVLLNQHPVAGVVAPDDLPTTLGDVADAARSLAATTGEIESKEWTALGEEITRLSQSDPLLAAVAGFYAIAAWEGSVEGDVLGFYERGPRPEWDTIGRPVAAALLRAGCTWCAHTLLSPALSMIEASRKYTFRDDDRVFQLAREFRGMLAEIARQHREAARALAWDLADHAHTLRGELAALFWTLGEAVDAALVSTRSTASRTTLAWLVHQSLRRGDSDPLTQDVWRATFNRREVSLHRTLARKLIGHAWKTPLRHVDDGSQPPLSRRHAEIAIAYFRDGTSSDLEQQFRSLRDTWLPVIMPVQPSDSLRLLAFDALAFDEPLVGMPDLAAIAANLVEHARGAGTYDYYDRSFDPIFAHLPARDQAELESTLDRIERYRVSGIAYWLTVTRPSLPRGDDVAPLLIEEETVIEELRGARFVRLTPGLPRHYQRYTINADSWESLIRSTKRARLTACVVFPGISSDFGMH